MHVLMIGDIFSSVGRRVIAKAVPELRREFDLDFVVANGENASNGKGLQADKALRLLEDGIDVITGGNHTWAFRDLAKVLENDARVLRPANYPGGKVPGRGRTIVKARNGTAVAVLNLIGRVNMGAVDCPFVAAEAAVEALREETPVILVDFHAEVTSEKGAMGRFLDGKVSAVVGTHTHVPTADGRVLPKGTAFQTDLGMTGPHDGIIGSRTDLVLEKFLTGLPTRLEPAEGEPRLQGVVIDIDDRDGAARSVTPVNRLIDIADTPG